MTVQNPASPRIGKKCNLFRDVSGLLGYAFRSRLTSKAPSWRPLQVCTRMQEMNCRQKRLWDWRVGEMLQAEIEGCSLGTSFQPCLRICCAWREHGSCLPRNCSSATAALFSRNIHGIRDTGWTVWYRKFVNRRCQSFSLAWEFWSFVTVKWLIAHLFGFLDPFVCFLSSINLC